MGYVIKRDRLALFGYVTETLAKDGRFYIQTNEPKKFYSIKDAKFYAERQELNDVSGIKHFAEGPKGGVYGL